MIRRFFSWNRALCDKIELCLPHARPNLFDLYEAVVARHMNARPNQVIADVGGGKVCRFAKYRDVKLGTRIVAVDIDAGELAQNVDADEKRVADIMRDLPFQEGEVDLVVSWSVLEHLTSLDRFIASSRRSLKDDGLFIHLFPCKFAPFTVINQLLPHAFSRKLLYFLHPPSVGIGGFPAFYDHCYHSAFTALLETHGFEVVELHMSYYQAPYFKFFVPFFLANVLYELLVYTLKIKNACAFILVVARKKAAP